MMRRAEHHDVLRLVELGSQMHAESNYAMVPYSHERVRVLLNYMLGNYDCFVAVWDRHGVVHGFMVGNVVPAWWGDGRSLVANDMGLYVEPKARHSAGAVMLAKAFKEWALRRGALQIRVGTAAGVAGQAANAVYEYLGFKCTGRCFLLDAQPAGQRDAAREGEQSCV